MAIVPNKRYTEDDKALALATYASNNNLRQTCRECDVKLSTLRAWVKGEAISPAVPGKTEEAKKDLASRLDTVVDMLVESIGIEVINDSSLVGRTTAIGTLIDKVQLLRKQPTGIEESRIKIVVEYAEPVAKDPDA